ncbi:MAG: hypothetical protein R3E10_06905 [Gemmatimonadota bacterium]
MEVRHAYCSACDRQVEVVVRPDLPEGQEPTAEDLVCLAHGDSCTGDLCPVFTVPTEEMKRRLEDRR